MRCVLRHTLVAVGATVTFDGRNRLLFHPRRNEPLYVNRREAALASVGLVEANEALAVLVPQRESKRGHARSQCDDGRRLHERILIMAALQPIVRNSRGEMMHVVKTNVPREPAQRG